ncbi:hypothetical protein [Mesorhizobium sp. M8A.F.Ca.ET.021.01.1.1]|uniref:hypothetical protein n=1 Tax=Mesorhizobium sp. M8A.F.Ca.ET.021.01.1.1 TaxID=2496757 RepID=UPI001679345A|nr:hypothetical protein [Mesorhizobium sp. M8A.F.Ca.ET.021.01.1.1]
MTIMSEPPRMRFATFLMTLESSTNMQRFIFRVLFALWQSGRAGHLRRSLDRSGKEAEKPLGKIFAKIPFDALFLAECFGVAAQAKFIAPRLGRQ